MKTFQQILADLELAAASTVVIGTGDVQAAAKIADVLLKIAQTAVKAHQDIIGEPLDLNLLQPIE